MKRLYRRLHTAGLRRRDESRLYRQPYFRHRRGTFAHAIPPQTQRSGGTYESIFHVIFQSNENRIRSDIHFRECKQFLAKVLERCPNMVNRIVND